MDCEFSKSTMKEIAFETYSTSFQMTSSIDIRFVFFFLLNISSDLLVASYDLVWKKFGKLVIAKILK